MGKVGKEAVAANALNHNQWKQGNDNWSKEQQRQWAQLTPQQQEQWYANERRKQEQAWQQQQGASPKKSQKKGGRE